MQAETLDIILRVMFYALLAVLTYVIVPAIKTWRTAKLNQDQRETLDYWVDVGVRWAKQWLQTSTGEEKKEAVYEFILEKVTELGLPYTKEDIDKAIVAVYESVKSESLVSPLMVAGGVEVAEEATNGISE